MKVSLVMAVYNGEKYLIEQLDSIRKQTYIIDEVILIDDVSTDNSYELIHQYIDGYKLINWKLIKNENNLGYRKNFKKGLEIVDGDIIFLSDQDDRWHLNKIEVMVEKMSQSNILSLASSFNFMDQDGNCFEVNKIKGRSNNNLKSLLEMNFSQGCCMAIKKEVKDEYLKVTQGKLPHDWELNIISAIQNGCYYLDIPLIDYRIHNNNTIGMDNIVDGNIINEKKQRVNERIEQTKAQIENVNFALGLELNREQKKYCLKYKDYLTQRVLRKESLFFDFILFKRKI